MILALYFGRKGPWATIMGYMRYWAALFWNRAHNIFDHNGIAPVSTVMPKRKSPKLDLQAIVPIEHFSTLLQLENRDSPAVLLPLFCWFPAPATGIVNPAREIVYISPAIQYKRLRARRAKASVLLLYFSLEYLFFGAVRTLRAPYCLSNGNMIFYL